MKLKTINQLVGDLWIFDNDGTLYTQHKAIEKEIVRLMILFIAKQYGLNYENALLKRENLLVQYMTKYTLIALKMDGINEKEFIQSTYLAIDPLNFGIKPNRRLRSVLQRLSSPLIVMTNNPSEYAKKILECLGIDDLFWGIYGMRELSYFQKPQIEAYRIIESFFKAYKRVIFVDDALENAIMAKKFGCTTILVDDQNNGITAPDHWIKMVDSEECQTKEVIKNVVNYRSNLQET